jgi:hypothetical protein
MNHEVYTLISYFLLLAHLNDGIAGIGNDISHCLTCSVLGDPWIICCSTLMHKMHQPNIIPSLFLKSLRTVVLFAGVVLVLGVFLISS